MSEEVKVVSIQNIEREKQYNYTVSKELVQGIFAKIGHNLELDPWGDLISSPVNSII